MSVAENRGVLYYSGGDFAILGVIGKVCTTERKIDLREGAFKKRAIYTGRIMYVNAPLRT